MELRCVTRVGKKRCPGILTRGMTNCHECGVDVEGMWAEFDVLTSPGAGLPPPKRRPKFGKVQRLGKRIRTWAGIALPGPTLSITLKRSIPFDDVESYDGNVVSMEHARRRRFRKGLGMDSHDAPLRRTEHWQNGDGTPKDLGEVWRLVKGPRVARCLMVGHPLGQEARIEIDGEVLPMTQVCKTTKDVADITAGWREGFEAKGWRSEDT